MLPSDVSYTSFGRHFEVKEKNDELKVVTTMNGQPIFSRSDPGTFAAPEEALEAIIDKYPMKDRILKAPDGGSDSHSNAVYTPIPKGNMGAFGTNLKAIAKGEVTVAAQYPPPRLEPRTGHYKRNGTLSAGPNSFASVAEADAYHAA